MLKQIRKKVQLSATKLKVKPSHNKANAYKKVRFTLGNKVYHEGPKYAIGVT